MPRYVTFAPPTDSAVWSNLIADNDVVGYGDLNQDYFRGHRYLGEYKGDGLGSVLGSLWSLVRPVFRDIGKSVIKEVRREVAGQVLGKRGQGADIFFDGKRRKTAAFETGSEGYKKAPKTTTKTKTSKTSK